MGFESYPRSAVDGLRSCDELLQTLRNFNRILFLRTGSCDPEIGRLRARIASTRLPIDTGMIQNDKVKLGLFIGPRTHYLHGRKRIR